MVVATGLVGWWGVGAGLVAQAPVGAPAGATGHVQGRDVLDGDEQERSVPRASGGEGLVCGCSCACSCGYACSGGGAGCSCGFTCCHSELLLRWLRRVPLRQRRVRPAAGRWAGHGMGEYFDQGLSLPGDEVLRDDEGGEVHVRGGRKGDGGAARPRECLR